MKEERQRRAVKYPETSLHGNLTVTVIVIVTVRSTMHFLTDLLLRAWNMVAIVPPEGELEISSKKFTSAKLSP